MASLLRFWFQWEGLERTVFSPRNAFQWNAKVSALAS